MRRNRRPIAKRPEYTQVGIRVILSQRLTEIVVERRKEEENAMLRMCRAAEVVNHSASPTTEGPATTQQWRGRGLAGRQHLQPMFCCGVNDLKCSFLISVCCHCHIVVVDIRRKLFLKAL